MAVEREVGGPSKVECPSERDFVDRPLLTFGLLTSLNNVHFYLDARDSQEGFTREIFNFVLVLVRSGPRLQFLTARFGQRLRILRPF